MKSHEEVEEIDTDIPEEFDESNIELDKSNEESDGESNNESDDSDIDDNYFMKLKNSTLKTSLLDMHHELKFSENSEVMKMCEINYVNGIIDDPNHRTLPFVSKYERARILGVRAKQLNSGHPSTLSSTFTNGYDMALKEYELKKIPFIIRRPLPNGKFEFWRFKDLQQLY